MTWSTRELAILAGTTVNTVRHYHRVGLLDQPERMSNGYKQYGVAHLVRLLQIRRLRDLGVPLEQIEKVGGAQESSADALAAIDADLARSIERLQRARAEIRAILQGSSATDVPSGFEDVAPLLSQPERALMLIYSRLYDDAAMADVKRMLETERDDASEAFNDLAEDAGEAERQELAERYAVTMARTLSDFPWLRDPRAHLSRSPEVTKNTFLESIVALYNPAQLDVIGRASVIAQQIIEQSEAGAEATPPTRESSG
ncbi:MerR family transcriptional regulator [Microbacterium sp. ET2]|uniref:MerR family transcriptional regulator n=1 Tax=Microbacterium albipurpureum TaxID=3050384 RepID=UPI00259C733A|nr:MerR family transcriptional regulator [Microbacterium sp. ET2 (Ac-2212)]WJL96621.1 MerR family transcriptional regulator [Microbacterium sp. ET2 (Ac-2212)]